ncbi:hypothetical protein ACFQY5_01395 [Paeniroseomonas aquatica]|uniref:hypothetical protein n=1 Tax=Paeniroseomonas aquatica TaxID=373043 RepID=UPI00361A7B3F
MLHRRHLLAAAAVPSLARPALAQPAEWPSRPIRLLVPYPPAGRTTSSPGSMPSRCRPC